MPILCTVEEVVAAVLAATEQGEIFHISAYVKVIERPLVRDLANITYNLSQIRIMPTVAVDKADLWERLGQEYSDLNIFPSLDLI